MRRYYNHVCDYEPCSKRFRSLRKTNKYCSRVCSNLANGPTRKNKLNEAKPVTVWSCGGGIESTAMAVLMSTGKLPKPDYAVMIDNGYEKSWTYQYVNEVIKPNLAIIGIELKIIPISDYSSNDLFDSTRHLIIPAFRKRPDGSLSKLHTHCNGPWKSTPVKRWMRSIGIEKAESWIGISADESNRMRQPHKLWTTHRYPLVEMNLSREECLWLIGREGWPVPKRSSCYFCPQTSDRQWHQLIKDAPGDWEKAVEMDKYIRTVDASVYLHRSCKPLGDVMIRL